MTTNRPRLTFFDRNSKFIAPDVRKNTTLPPRKTFEGQKAALEAYDNYTATIDARTREYREARKLRDEASAGRTAYNRAIREALTAGTPTDGITDPHDALIKQAEHHEDLAAQADVQLITLGLILGQAIHKAAPKLFKDAEKSMEAAASRVRADIEALRESWATWSEAWQTRVLLSESHLNGGALRNYDPRSPLPKDVVDALNTIEARLNDLETLKHDEALLIEWRAQQTKAAAYVPEPTPQWTVSA